MVLDDEFVLSRVEGLLYSAPQLGLADHGLILGPDLEMLVVDADPLLSGSAWPGFEERIAVRVKIALVDGYLSSSAIVEGESVVEGEPG